MRRSSKRRPRTRVIDGQEYVVVFDGHRDGPLLLTYDDRDDLRADHTIERGILHKPRRQESE
jgi:hypothetical protein